MRKLIMLAILVACSAPLTFAQTVSTDDYNKVNFFAGFSHNRVDTNIADDDPDFDDIIDEREGFNGFNTSITGNVSRYVGLKADYSFHRKSFSFVDADLHNILGGVQIKDNSKTAKVKPFAHALVGAAIARADVDQVVCAQVIGAPCPTDLDESETGLAGAFGGGIDLRVSDRLDVRAIQFDWNPTRLGDRTQHNFRIGVGIVIR